MGYNVNTVTSEREVLSVGLNSNQSLASKIIEAKFIRVSFFISLKLTMC